MTAVKIVKSDPPGSCERAAKRVGKQIRFRPAVKDGRPYATVFDLAITWNLDN